MKYRVYFINHDYYSQEEFDTCNGAIAYGIDKGFEFAVHYGSDVVASWGPIRGLWIQHPEVK